MVDMGWRLADFRVYNEWQDVSYLDMEAQQLKPHYLVVSKPCLKSSIQNLVVLGKLKNKQIWCLKTLSFMKMRSQPSS